MNENQNLGPPQITSIVAFSKGFACSCGPGTVAWFEKSDDKEYFKKVIFINSTTFLQWNVDDLKKWFNLVMQQLYDFSNIYKKKLIIDCFIYIYRPEK